jgi:hypothetical protein
MSKGKLKLLNNVLEVEQEIDQDDMKFYSYKGTWKKGVKEGFGIEKYSLDRLKNDRDDREDYLKK